MPPAVNARKAAQADAARIAQQLQQLVQLWQSQDWPACLALAQQLTSRVPEQGLPWKLLGSLYERQQQWTQAAEAYAQAARCLPEDAEVCFNWANVCAQSDQLAQGVSLYQQAIQLQPAWVAAYANLASLLKQQGQYRQAEQVLHQALAIAPEHGWLLFELAGLLQEQGQPLAALPYYRQAVVVEPDNPVLAFNMGMAFEAAGNWPDALQQFSRATQLAPDYLQAWLKLAATYLRMGQDASAEQAYQQALALAPHNWEILNHLLQLYQRLQQPEAYRLTLQTIMQLSPDADAINGFTAQLINQNLFAEAERYCTQALALADDNPYICCNMAVIMHHRQEYAQAAAWYEKALALKPDSAPILSNYSVALRMQGRLTESGQALARALALAPEYVDAHINLGNLEMDRGQIAAAVATFQHVLTLDVTCDKAYRNLLFADSYANLLGPAQHLAYARQYGALMTARATPFQHWQLHANDQRLRVGIVSADLRNHPVGYFVTQWLQHHDAGQTEIYAYSTDGKEDALSQQLKQHCTQWRSLAGLSDAQAARQIHADGIHVLLDLSGFTADSRVSLFAWKPAPVQMSWLGYWATTGLPAMDYVIADAISVPEQAASAYSERIARLPATRMCFAAPQEAVEVNDLPALTQGHLTLGCFQNYAKVSEDVLTLWAEVMAALPHAQLRWQSKAFSEPDMQAQALARLAQAGIAAGRCQLVGKTSRHDYLLAHHDVDMILDSFPFTGGTTTCEALWMGVPTLTLAGETMIARQGASMLHAAGLADWVVEQREAYVARAVHHAQDLAGLAALRQRLRAQVMASPLMDGPAFASAMTQLLQKVWQQHVPGLVGQCQAVQAIQDSYHGQSPVWVVSATRKTANDFWQQSALGISLRRQMQKDNRLVAHIAYENRQGLPEVFNQAIDQAPEDALLLFVHDDVWLDQHALVATLQDGLSHYDVLGVAGNQQRVPGQPGWLFEDTRFTWAPAAGLLGKVAHGQFPFGPTSVYGQFQGQSTLMDGVLFAAHARVLKQHAVQFDSRFDFHFYDLDFCRSASLAQLSLGVWPIAITHQSEGAFGTPGWWQNYQRYLQKWEPSFVAAPPAQQHALEAAIADVLQLATQYQQSGEWAQAETMLKEVLQVSPQHTQALAQLAALHQEQAMPVAETPAETGVPAARPPSSVEISALLALFEQQQFAQMESGLQDWLQRCPRWAEGWRMLADLYMICKQDAREPARQWMLLNPEDAQAHCYYGLALKTQGDLLAAKTAFTQAIALDPNAAAAHNNLAIVLKDLGQVEAAIVAFERALQLQPAHAEYFSNLLFCLSHAEAVDTATLFAAHQAYADRYESPLQATWQPHPQARDAHRKLRIGMVSADFRAHSLANFLLPVLPALASSETLTLYAYSNCALSDAVTAQMQPYFAHWQEVSGLSDAALAARIRADEIDILLDLSGHTAGNRLLTFAHKPAPLQVSWLGYLNSTGLRAMDYYLADAVLAPPGALDDQFSEQLVQLPVNASFMPDAASPDVNLLPALNNGYITFGCFNRPAKITQVTIACWARLLLALPQSRLLLGGMAGESSAQHLQHWLLAAGITEDRVTFLPRGELTDYLQQYHAVDICLDTFPSNGVTTTAHALWMGVPTLCLAGDRLASRGAMALMQHVGLPAWVAEDADDWLMRGMALATDTQALASLRQQLRQQYAGSVLAQHALQADALEQAFRHMWQQWCEGAPAASFHIQTAAEAAALSMEGAPMTDQPSASNTAASIATLLAQGKICQEAGEIAQAVACYQQVLAQDAQHAEAHHHLGFIEVHTQGVAQAMPHLEAAVMAAPGCEQYWVTYIDALIMLQDLTTAEAAITHGLGFGLSVAHAQLLRDDIQAHRQAAAAAPKASAPMGPRITTLVPAYKPEYLAELLSALSAQTYRHFRVIVSDDSPEQQVTQLLRSPTLAPLVSQLNLHIVQGPRKGTMTNIVHLLAQCDDDDGLVHVLFDDDLIYPRFYEKHVQAHQQANVGASVSYRWYCNAHGQPLGVTAVPAFVEAASTACQPLSAEQLFGSTIADCNNWLGEFSNAVFKLQAVRLYAHSHLAEIPYYGLGDIGVLLDIAQQQQVVLVKEYLGAFRQHDSQHSVNYGSRVFKCGLVAWVALALGAYKLGRVPATVLQGVVSRMHGILTSRYADAADMQPLRQLFASEAAHTPLFEQQFRPLWASLLAGDDWLAAQALQGQYHDAVSAIPA